MHRIQYGPDANHFGHLRIPAGASRCPLLVVIHGGFWRDRYDLSHMDPLCAVFENEGIATWSIEYRRIGQPGGGWPGTVDDAVAGARHRMQLAREFPIDLDRCAVIGYSAGGHLALCVASSDSAFTGVIALAGVADLQMAWDLRLSDGVVRDFLGGLPGDAPLASPTNRAIGIPQRLVHGVLDQTVPLAVARAYAAAKREQGEDVSLIEAGGATHNDLIDPASATWPLVRQAIVSLL